MKPSKKTQRKLERRLKAYDGLMSALSKNAKFNPKAYRRPGSRNQHSQ